MDGLYLHVNNSVFAFCGESGGAGYPIDVIGGSLELQAVSFEESFSSLQINCKTTTPVLYDGGVEVAPSVSSFADSVSSGCKLVCSSLVEPCLSQIEDEAGVKILSTGSYITIIVFLCVVSGLGIVLAAALLFVIYMYRKKCSSSNEVLYDEIDTQM